MNLLLKWLIMALSILICAYVIPGVAVSGFVTALWLALFLGLLNIIVRPLLILITLPINILTLGLFIFIINAILILIASTAIKGFSVDGFWAALLFSIALSVASYVLNTLFKKSL